MTQHTNLSPRAFTAIAAVLALSTTPALAQEAVPAASAPVAAEPPAPSIVASPAPELRSERTVVSEPVIQTVPVVVPTLEPAVAATPVARASSAARTTAPRSAARTAASAPAAAVAAPLAEAIAPVTVAPVAEVAPIIPQSELTATPVSEPASDNTLLFGGLLAALGLGGAFALTGRRKRDVAEPVVFERPVVAAPPQPASIAAVAPLKPMFAFAPAPEIERKVERVAAPAPILTGAVPHGEERQTLLDRMVAAAPDKANPFTSAKGRRKRARIMLQSREAAQQSNPAVGTPASPRATTPVREFEPA